MVIDGYLDFEEPIKELDNKIAALVNVADEASKEQLQALKAEKEILLKSIYKSLTPWQIVQVARHPNRPYPNDLIPMIFTDINELEGDRHSAKAQAIYGGMGYLDEQPVMIIAHKKGHTIEENLACNFGCAQPEGFRKAKRLMKLAERFNIPVITMIDTKGAYPGIEAEKHNQSEAIAENLLVMSQLKVPIITVIIGEGCSGGALAIGVGNRNLMLEHSYYSVISPEGCASILWRDANKKDKAADIMKLTANDLKTFGLIDLIVNEPIGGAHQDKHQMADHLKATLTEQLQSLVSLSIDEIVQDRYQKIRHIDQNY